MLLHLFYYVVWIYFILFGLENFIWDTFENKQIKKRKQKKKKDNLPTHLAARRPARVGLHSSRLGRCLPSSAPATARAQQPSQPSQQRASSSFSHWRVGPRWQPHLSSPCDADCWAPLVGCYRRPARNRGGLYLRVEVESASQRRLLPNWSSRPLFKVEPSLYRVFLDQNQP
jgi:hypothetical protein